MQMATAVGCSVRDMTTQRLSLQRHLVIDNIVATRYSASGARATDEEAEDVTSLSDGTCGVCHPPIGRGPPRRRRLPARTAGGSRRLPRVFCPERAAGAFLSLYGRPVQC